MTLRVDHSVAIRRRLRRNRRFEVVSVDSAGLIDCFEAHHGTLGGAAALLVQLDGSRRDMAALERILAVAASVPVIVVDRMQGNHNDLTRRALELGAEDVVPVAEATATRLEHAILAATYRRSPEPSGDPLTGMADRLMLDKRLAEMLSDPGRSQVAVLYGDLDGFKRVNDGHGHGTGDAVLKAAAERIRAAVRSSHLVVRMGGDEFVVVLHSRSDVAVLAGVVAHRMVASFREPFGVGVTALDLSVSVGVACHREGGERHGARHAR